MAHGKHHTRRGECEKCNYPRCFACGARHAKYLELNGVRVESNYCAGCVCTQVTGGRTCPNRRKYAHHPWCAEHLRCSVGGCYHEVKDLNPRAFRFCRSVHGCTVPGCPDRREGTASVCNNHKCQRPGCDETRDPGGGSRYCGRHTCEAAECGNLVVYDSESPAGDQRRFCSAHRRCARPGCVRICHMHDDGSLAPFCGDHRCHAGACQEERGAGQFCPDHTCREQGCTAGRADERGEYCADHECSRESCRLMRHRAMGAASEWCSRHKCSDWECMKEQQGETGFCERHMPCSTEGCMRRRVLDGERLTAHCEIHTPPTCARRNPPCTNQVVPNGRFCPDHTCVMDSCLSPRDMTTFPQCELCTSHRCAVDHCPNVRQYPFAAAYTSPLVPGHHAFCVHHGCQFAARRCLNQAVDGGRFCRRHECAVANCHEEIMGLTRRLCEDHVADRDRSILQNGVYGLAGGSHPGLGGAAAYPAYGLEPRLGLGGGFAYGAVPSVPHREGWPGRVYEYGPGRRHYEFDM